LRSPAQVVVIMEILLPVRTILDCVRDSDAEAAKTKQERRQL